MNEFDFDILTAGEPAQFGKYSLRLRLSERKQAYTISGFATKVICSMLT